MKEPKRKTATIARVKNSLRLRSGVRNARITALINLGLLAKYYLLTEPPAAKILDFACSETLSTFTSSLTEMSPEPRTFTGSLLRTRPLLTRSAIVTAPPCGKCSASFSRFTTWYSILNGFLKPRSFGVLITRRTPPPSKPGRTWYLALVPLVPRPEVLPLDASPRPTRMRSFLEPGAGRRWCNFRIGDLSAGSAFFFFDFA